MSDKTEISWTDATWSPVTGCTRISDGCTNCYIERTPPFRMAHRRFNGDGVGSTTGVQLHPERLRIPMHWRKPRKVFVCSMADLFHDDVPDDYIASVFGVMAVCPDHPFQVLTKRPTRMRSLLGGDFRDQVAEETTELLATTPPPGRYWPLTFDRTTEDGFNIWGPVAWPLPNVWVGTTVESADYLWRIDKLRENPAAVRFLSLEPLLGPLPNLDLTGIDWVIVGGESGPGARPMHPAWVRDIRDQCQAAGVAFHFKQWGEWTPERGVRHNDFHQFDNDPGSYVMRVGKKAAGRELDGRTWDEYPKTVSA